MSGSSVASAATRKPEKAFDRRRGSRFSDKQIAQAVKDRRAVEIISTDGGRLATGFVYGMDDYHLGIVDYETRTMLVHKASAAVIRFGQSILDDLRADVAAQISEICEPFRERVMREHFSQTSPQ